MILPILPNFEVDTLSIEIVQSTVYFDMKLGISWLNCHCSAASVRESDVVSPTSDPQDDQEIDFDSLAVSNEYDRESVVFIEDSNENNLVGLHIGLTDIQVSKINTKLNELCLDAYIENEKEEANDY